MSDQDEFDSIINNQPEGSGDNDDESKLENIWAGIEHLWPHFYEGILVKGILLAEYVDPEDGGKVLRFVSSPDATPWEMLGMLESARMDARDLSRSCMVLPELEDDEDDD